MTNVFRILQPKSQSESFRAYWVESTAPNNVEDQEHDQALPDETLEVIDPQIAINNIVSFCLDPARSQAPTIAVFVHGYNSPVSAVFNRFKAAFNFLNSAAGLTVSKDTVAIGYHWPSEGAVPLAIKPALHATPQSVKTILWLAGILGVAGLVLLHLRIWVPLTHILGAVLAILSFVLLGVIGAVILERVIVYFRDNFRAMNYGVLDFMEFLRQIDKAAVIANHDEPLERKIKLSFIGHSMGAFVVTNLVRIMSDVFDKQSIGELDTADQKKNPTSKIGHAFELGRLVLVSPDISAEALLASRANYLQPSLRRFDEAYLFSNQGDIVLSQVSMLGSYFSFPSRTLMYGQRLGNVRLQSDAGQYGIIQGNPMTTVTIGGKSLQELSDGLGAAVGKTNNFYDCFSYFDCTDYTDNLEGATRGVVSYALKKANLSASDNNALLRQYFFKTNDKIDVHSGYFDGPLSSRLIYSLACTGITATTAAFAANGGASLSAECESHGIRVML
jgi:hypothetical protein